MLFSYYGLKLEVPKGVYYPSEDSLFLCDWLIKNRPKFQRAIDVGCGCGLIAILLAKLSRKKVEAIDVSELAVEATRQNAKRNRVRVRTYLSDLLSNAKGSYDLIVSNPPYLPQSPEDRLLPKEVRAMWCGGKEFIERLLREGSEKLRPKGSIAFVYSSLSLKRKNIEELAAKFGLKAKVVNCMKLPWEELYLVVARSEDEGSEEGE